MRCSALTTLQRVGVALSLPDTPSQEPLRGRLLDLLRCNA